MKTRMQHLRFFRLALGERFDINMVPYKKAGTFSAWRVFTGALRRMMPWDKVRSRRPVSVAEHATLVAAAVGNVKAECCGSGGGGCFPGDGGGVTAQTIERGPAYRGIMGCQGDGDASGDRTPETIGGNEKTPSA